MKRKFLNLSLVASLIFATLFLSSCEDSKTPEVPPANTIADVRALEVSDSLTQDWTVKGTVISNNSTTDGGNVNADVLVIQDSKDAKSGITIQMLADHAFLLGQEVEVKIKGNKLENYRGTIRIEIGADDKSVTKVAEADLPKVEALLQTITVEQLKGTDYQSMYIAIAEAQVKADDWGKKFNGNIMVSAATQDFVMRTGSSAFWKDVVVPGKKGILKGLVGLFQYNAEATATYQLMPQRPTDYVGLGDEPSVPPPFEGIFRETFGEPDGTTQFADFNTAKGFSKTNQTAAVYSANSRVSIRTSSSSANAYEGASGGGNAWFATLTETGGVTNFLTMDKLSITQASILTYGFNTNVQYNETNTVEDMIVSYKIGDAGAWVVLTKTSATPTVAAPWVLVTCAEIPTGVTTIKFETSVDALRLDDVTINAK